MLLRLLLAGLLLTTAWAVPSKLQFSARPVATERAVAPSGEAHRFHRREFWVDFGSDAAQAGARSVEYAARWGVTCLGPVFDGATQYLFAQDWDASGVMQARGAATLGTELVPLSRMKRYVPRGTLFGRGPQAVPARTTYNITDPGIRAQWHHGGEGRFYRAPVHLNNPAAWEKGFTGAGVTVLVSDDGVQTTHEDFACGKVDPDCSYSLILNESHADPSPLPDHAMHLRPVFDEDHGTACAGLVAACKDGSKGGVGVAYDARICAVRILKGTSPTTDLMEARALVIGDKAAVSTDSWGPDDYWPSFGGPHELRQRQEFNATHYGRNGLGVVLVVAGGNGACSIYERGCAVTESLTYQGGFSDGYVGNPNAYAVGGITDHGIPASYSEAYTGLAFSGPTSGGSEGLYTTDACDSGDCYMNDMGGTSGVAPLVAGQFALAISARPSATRRELYHAAVHSAQEALAARFRIAAAAKTSYPSLGPRARFFPWTANGAGIAHSDLIGFGIIDSGLFVDNVRNASVYYRSLPEEHMLRASVSVSTPLVSPMSTTVYTRAIAPNATELMYIEHVQLAVSISFGNSAMRCARIALSTPDGTRSDFIPVNLRSDKASVQTSYGHVPLTYDQGSLDWVFLTRKPFMTKAAGTYIVLVENKCGDDDFRVSSLTLYVSGLGAVPGFDNDKPLFPPYFAHRK